MTTEFTTAEIAEMLDRMESLATLASDNAVLGLCALARHLLTQLESLRAERLEIQRALAATVLNDPSEDDDPPYSTTEIVNGINMLERRRRNGLQRSSTANTRWTSALALVERKAEEWESEDYVHPSDTPSPIGPRFEILSRAKANTARELLRELKELEK